MSSIQAKTEAIMYFNKLAANDNESYFSIKPDHTKFSDGLVYTTYEDPEKRKEKGRLYVNLEVWDSSDFNLVSD